MYFFLFTQKHASFDVNQPESVRGSEVQGHFGIMGSQHGTSCLAPI